MTDATEDMGCIRVIPGSHKLGVLDTYVSPSGKRPALYLDTEKYPVESATPHQPRRTFPAFHPPLATCHSACGGASSPLEQ
ncbi:MAG: phytanoyl-CoA dioxygenase family protein [Verrucomicrobia bacterium]|nr:phytanoyl-CoA dioxygenase family protein [Verrucomicrobiota bacterium]